MCKRKKTITFLSQFYHMFLQWKTSVMCQRKNKKEKHLTYIKSINYDETFSISFRFAVCLQYASNDRIAPLSYILSVQVMFRICIWSLYLCNKIVSSSFCLDLSSICYFIKFIFQYLVYKPPVVFDIPDLV